MKAKARITPNATRDISITIKYLIFNELFANYLALIKLKNSEEHLLFLRQIVGDGIIDMLDNYYKEHILNEEKTLRR